MSSSWSSDTTMSTGSCKIADAVKSIQVDKNFLDKTLGSNRMFWETFSKNNSHRLRAQLFELFDAAKLSREAQFTVYFISSKATNIDKAWVDLTQKFNNFNSQQLYKDVEKFLKSHLSQYALPDRTSTKFPIVNIPSTLPPMDILCCMLQTKNLSLDEMLAQITSVQLNLNKDAQTYAKAKFWSYWRYKFRAYDDLMMRELGDILSSPEKQEEFYLNYAGDKYNLTTMNFQEICPAGDGYTLEEIGAYLLVEASPEFLKKDSTMMSLDDVETKWKNDRALTPTKLKLLAEMRQKIENMLADLRDDEEIDLKEDEERDLRLKKEDEETDLKEDEERDLRLKKEDEETDLKEDEERDLRLKKEDEDTDLKEDEERDLRLKKEDEESDLRGNE